MSVIADQLTTIIAEILELPVEDICLDKNLNEFMQADSVMILEILVALERTFKIEIKEAEFKTVNTLQDLVELIEKKIQ